MSIKENIKYIQSEKVIIYKSAQDLVGPYVLSKGSMD